VPNAGTCFDHRALGVKSARRKSRPNPSHSKTLIQLCVQIASTADKPKNSIKIATLGPITGVFIVPSVQGMGALVNKRTLMPTSAGISQSCP
jgi:hypothetical protein